MNTHMVHREGSEGVRVEEKEGGGDGGEAGTREERRRGHRSSVTGTRGGRTNVGVGDGGSGSRMGERTAERERETERAAAGERIRLGFGRGMCHGRTAYIRRGERGGVRGVGRRPAACLRGPFLRLGRHRATSSTVPCPCRATGQADGPGTARCLGPGQHGHGGHRAGPDSGRAKTTGHGPGRRAAGCMAKYSSASPDTEAAGSASPEPWVFAPPRPASRRGLRLA